MGLTLTVIVPVYNGGVAFTRCLQALAASDRQPDELLVVDDGSTDSSAAVAQHYAARLLYTAKPRSGPSVARNLGAAEARGDVLFFTDADCAVHPDTLARLMAHFEGGNPPEAVIGSYDTTPSESNFLSQYRNLLHHFVHQHASDDASTFWGGCGGIRREVFLRLRGFDSVRYPRPSIEDIDLGYRLKAQGGRIVLDKDLLVTHLKRWTPLRVIRTDILDRGIPWTRLLLSNRNIKADLNLKVEDRISVILVYLLLLSLLLVLLTSYALFISGVLAGVLLVLNRHLYGYLARLRGPVFALVSIFWHWLYYFYNGVSFSVGTALHIRDTLAKRTQ